MKSINSAIQGQLRLTCEIAEGVWSPGLRTITGAGHHHQIRYEYPVSAAHGPVH